MRLKLTLAFAFVVGCAEDPSRALPAAPDAGADAIVGDVAVDARAVDDAVDAPTDGGDAVVADAAVDATQQALRVLFVGNSYTYVNDLPGLLTRMAEAGARVGQGPTIETDSVAVGGATLRDHWTTGTASARITTESWTAVVLQGQSVEPVLNYSDFRVHGVRFGMLIGGASARAVFYATWARREGDVLYRETWSGGSPSVFAMRLDLAYSQVAAMVDGEVAHVGNAWMTALREHPTLQLFDADGSHPSPAGTFLTACVLYRTITGRAVPDVVDGVAGVASADARALRESSASP